ncbi:MAG: MFS transporter, partial [Actinomycetota bacterium]|nr:MFS transporter [Actinomycetota bacterium]
LSVPAVAQWGDDQPEFETLGGTLEAAAQYPNWVGADLLHSAHAAFDLGIQRSSATAIVIALAAAVLSFRTLQGAKLHD